VIEEGTKVETDTSRTMSDTSFDAAFAADDEPADTVPPITEPTAPSDVTAPETQVSPAVESPSLPDGYKLDTLGRVHGPDGRVVSKEEAEKIKATVPSTPVVSTAAVGTPSDTKPVAPLPFQYRSFGETKAVEGYNQNEDGSVVVSAEKVSELRHLHSLRESLAQDSTYVDQVKAENATLKQQLEDRTKSSSVDSEKARTLVASYSQMLSEPDDAKAVEAFFTLRANYPILLAEAKAKYFERLATEGRPPTTKQEPERAQEPTAPQGLPQRESAVAATQDNIERIKLDHKYRDVTPTDWKQFTDRASRVPYAYLRPATQDDAKYGARPGEIVFDLDALSSDVEEYAGQIRKVRATASAAAFNTKMSPVPANGAKPKPRALVPTADTARGPTFDEAWNTPDE
jgi:hypothetical protein